MSAISLQTAQAQLTIWIEADAAVALGQEYQIDISGNKRRLTRADAAVITKKINYWSTIVNRLQAGGSLSPRVRMAIPIDR